MHVCIYVCTHVCIFTYIYIYTHIYICVCVCMNTYIFHSLSLSLSIYIYIWVNLFCTCWQCGRWDVHPPPLCFSRLEKYVFDSISWIFVSNSNSEENNIKYYSNDNGILSIMYHRFNENKYPSTNIKMDIFIEHLKIIKENYPSGKLVICGSLYLAGEVLKQDGFKIN